MYGSRRVLLTALCLAWSCIGKTDCAAVVSEIQGRVHESQIPVAVAEADVLYQLAIELYRRQIDEHKQSKTELFLKLEMQRKRQWRLKYLKKGVIWRYSSMSVEERTQYEQMLAELWHEVCTNRYPEDFDTEIEALYRAAAEQGHVDAQFALSDALERGVGVCPDQKQAFAWAYVAAIQKPPFGRERLEELARWLSIEERMEAQWIGDEYVREYTSVWERPSVTLIQQVATDSPRVNWSDD